MQRSNSTKLIDWLYPLKKKIISGIFVFLTLTIALTMVFIAMFLRSRLIDDSKIKTQELGDTIKTSIGCLMLKRDPDMIQNTVQNLRKTNNSITKAYIIDKAGRVAYSSDTGEIGKKFDKFSDESCSGCHQAKGAIPSETTVVIKADGTEVHRNVKVIYNEKECYGCHSQADRINGKLIIDRSLKQTYTLIATIELIIFGSGVACLILLMPFLSKILSKGVDRYISKIINQNSELTLLYLMIERLSKTIELDELKHIVIEIVKDTLNADSVDIITHKNMKEYSVSAWSKGKEKTTRKRIEKEDPLSAIIDGWLEGKFNTEKFSEDGKQIYIPIIKGATPFALIAVRKSDQTFDPLRLNLVGALRSHIAVAFENAMLYRMAITDELTRLYTQRHFRYSIDKKFLDFEKYGEKITLLIADLDDFKKINDTYGHVAGDSVLKEVARCILSSIRDNDLAFRYGGEEFTVILPSTDREGGRQVAERIRENIETSVFEKGTHNLKITISIGASTCPDNAKTVRDLIVTADQALYKAKQTGKNKVVAS